jgi:hypothetical protein
MFYNLLLIIRIQCIRRLIQKNILRILIHSPCNQYSLLLSAVLPPTFAPTIAVTCRSGIITISDV